MLIRSQGRLGVRAATLGVWTLAAGSMVYWGLRLSAGLPDTLAPPPATAGVTIDAPAVGRVLGAVPVATPQAVSLASRFALQGVVAEASGRGAALIAVDGKPARSYRVGSAVEDGLLLQSVAPRQATLAAAMDSPAALTLEMPPLRH
jgi:general secretion pathway protein C